MNITSRNFFVTIAGIVLLAAGFLPLASSAAEADKVDPEKLVEQAKTVYEEHVGPETKNFFTRMFAKLEAFRTKTAADLEIKRDAKAAEYEKLKQQEIHSITDNTEKVLEGEQTTLYEGASSRISFDKILVRVVLAGLGILVFIFTSKIVFYVIFAVVVLAIIKTIIDRIRAPRPVV